MTEDRYYIRFKGRILGPLPPSKIHEMVRRGQITRQHELAPDGQNWGRAEEFEDFFPKLKIKASGGPKTGEAGATPTENLEWYAHFDGNKQGPVDEQGMKQWIVSRKVRGETMIWKSGMSSWLEARSVRPEWFESNHSTAGKNGLVASSDEAEYANLDSIAFEAVKPRGWILFIGILGIIATSLGLLGGIFSFVANVFGTASEPVKAFAAMTFLVQIFTCLAGLFISITLIRVTTKLQILQLQPRWQTLQDVFRVYQQYWFAVGLTSLIGLVLIGILVVFVMLLAGSGNLVN